MKKSRLRIFIVLFFVVLSGVFLLQISQKVQDSETRLAQMSHELQGEREALKILEVEWAYLNAPQRLEQLATQYLDLMPPDSARLSVDSDVLPQRVTSKRNVSKREVLNSNVLLHQVSQVETRALEAVAPANIAKPHRKPSFKSVRRAKEPAGNFDDLLKKMGSQNISEGAP